MRDLAKLADDLSPAMIEAGRAIMEIYRSDFEVITKEDGSPVTAADEAAEVILLAALKEAAPEIPVVSEENANSHNLAVADAYFLVDPIDGTKEFLKQDGKGAFTVNIGLIVEGAPVMGLIYAPVFETLYRGIAGQGASRAVAGGAPEAIATRAPSGKLTAVASASHRDEATNEWLDARGITDTKAIGSSLKFCLVAIGEADLYPRFGPTMEWDTAAGDAIVRAAGGMTFFEDGTPYHYGKESYRNVPFFVYGNEALI